MSAMNKSARCGGSDQEGSAGVRLVALNLPEDEGEGLGFRLTRTLWDPYPWVRGVTPGARAAAAGLRAGDCLLQADGRDLLGLPVGQVAGLIRGDGAGRGVSLLVWSCGLDPKDDPELLWSCGGGARGERSRRALGGVLRALACCVCAATATRPLSCARNHLYCEACWSRLERCALCREALPPKDSPYAKNLVAEQVFDAIATEYEIKDTVKKPTQSTSAYTSPNRSPNLSPSVGRKGQYQLSFMSRKKTVQFNEKYGPSYASDPNIHRSSQNQQESGFNRQIPTVVVNSTNVVESPYAGNSGVDGGKGGKSCSCSCQNGNSTKKITKSCDEIPQVISGKMEDAASNSCQNLLSLQHKLVARLRPACSLVDLQNGGQTCVLSQSLNNINLSGKCQGDEHHTGSLDDLKTNCGNTCDPPLLVLSPPPIYVISCEHGKYRVR